MALSLAPTWAQCWKTPGPEASASHCLCPVTPCPQPPPAPTLASFTLPPYALALAQAPLQPGAQRPFWLQPPTDWKSEAAAASAPALALIFGLGFELELGARAGSIATTIARQHVFCDPDWSE